MYHCLLCEHTNDDVFDDFLKISKNCSKISENALKIVRKPDNRFANIFQKFPKTADDFRR